MSSYRRKTMRTHFRHHPLRNEWREETKCAKFVQYFLLDWAGNRSNLKAVQLIFLRTTCRQARRRLTNCILSLRSSVILVSRMPQHHCFGHSGSRTEAWSLLGDLFLKNGIPASRPACHNGKQADSILAWAAYSTDILAHPFVESS